jgi:hypothetical protein
MHKNNLGVLRSIVSEFENLPMEKKGSIISKANCLPKIMGPEKLIIQRSISDFYSNKLPKEIVVSLLKKMLSKYENPETPQEADGDNSETSIEVDTEAITEVYTPPVDTKEINETPHKIKLPTTLKKGDVIFSFGLNHPIILLYKKKDVWICAMMTSNPKCPEVLCKAESRFFPESYITKTLLSQSVIYGKYMFPYDNPKHLNYIYGELKNHFLG